MRLLWTTNAVPPQLADRFGHSVAGHWMWALLEILRSEVDSITVVTEQEGVADAEMIEGNLRAIVIGVPKPISKWLPRQRCSEAFIKRVAEIECDIIHVHGTEHPYAASCRMARPGTPIALSIQGLIGPYSRYMQGTLKATEAILGNGPVAALRGTSPFGVKFAFARGSRYELLNLAAADLVFCRTSWDTGHVRSMRPEVRIHYGGEVIRPAFTNAVWSHRSIPAREPRLLFTNGAAPVKNVGEILESVAILVRRGILPQLRLAGFGSLHNQYVRDLIHRAKILGIEERVVFLGYLTTESIIAEMLEADVFISASLIDNSPNSVCEAQLVGVPVVASAVGGVLDLVHHGRTGLLYQVGEIPQLAESIARLITNPSLAAEISKAAREAAAARHSVGAIRKQYLSAYRELMPVRS